MKDKSIAEKNKESGYLYVIARVDNLISKCGSATPNDGKIKGWFQSVYDKVPGQYPVRYFVAKVFKNRRLIEINVHSRITTRIAGMSKSCDWRIADPTHTVSILKQELNDLCPGWEDMTFKVR